MPLIEKYPTSLDSIVQLIVPILFLSLSVGTAQPIWDARQTAKEISVQYQRPALTENLFSNSTGSSIFLTGRMLIRERKSLIIQLPYLNGKTSYKNLGFSISPSEVNDNIIGNVYVGLESHKEDSDVFTNIGVFLPTVPDDKFVPIFVNLFGDADQYESYIPNFTTVAFRLNKNTNSMNENGLGVILRLGISGMIYTGKSGSGNDKMESLLSYAFQPTVHFDAVDILVGFSGKMILTEDGDLDQRVLHQAGLSASYSLQFLRLTMFARIPVNEMLRNRIDNTLGGAVTMEF